MAFSDRLRERVRKHISPCPTCGHRDIGGIREIARQMGVDHSQLSGFLLGTKTLGQESIDKVMTWLDEHPEPLRTTLPGTITEEYRIWLDEQHRKAGLLALTTEVPSGTKAWLRNAGYAEQAPADFGQQVVARGGVPKELKHLED